MFLFFKYLNLFKIQILTDIYICIRNVFLISSLKESTSFRLQQIVIFLYEIFDNIHYYRVHVITVTVAPVKQQVVGPTPSPQQEHVGTREGRSL